MKWPGGFWQIGQTTNVIGLVFWLLCSIAFTWAMWNEEEEEKS
jgi:ABC-type glucose/galactose transport system permease subunit